MPDFEFPTEVIDLPSKGLVYPKDSPLSKGQIELKYMTAKEEDILSSQNLIKKGIVLDKLFDSLIVSPGVKQTDLVVGDKNAVMMAARVLAYGPQYKAQIQGPDGPEEVSFDLTKINYKKINKDVDYSENKFEMELPVSKLKITFKILTGAEENKITQDLAAVNKSGGSAEVTTRLRYMITSVDGKSDKPTINKFVTNMLSQDSLALRKYYAEISPDVELEQEVELGGEMVKVNIPMTVRFFWPDSSV